MKKVLFTLTILFITGGVVFGIPDKERNYRDELFTQDTRITAMGGFTAVSDDVNAINYNPAGLSFQRYPQIMFSGLSYFDVSGEIGDTGEPYYKLDDSADAGDFVISGMSLISRIGVVNRNWGISVLSDIGIIPMVTAEVAHEQLEVQYDIYNKVEVAAGAGFNIGFFALGCSIRVIQEHSMSTDTVTQERHLGYVTYGGLFRDYGKDIFTITSFDPHIEAGIGVMANFGVFRAGLYSERFILLNDAEGNTFFNDALKSTNIGIALVTPNPISRRQFQFPLFFIAAADINQLGDNEKRNLAVGGEVGLRVGRIGEMRVRAAYRQLLQGGLTDISLDITDGEVFIGTGAYILGVDLNFAWGMPASKLFSGDKTYGNHGDPRLSLSIGMKL